MKWTDVTKYPNDVDDSLKRTITRFTETNLKEK